MNLHKTHRLRLKRTPDKSKQYKMNYYPAKKNSPKTVFSIFQTQPLWTVSPQVVFRAIENHFLYMSSRPEGEILKLSDNNRASRFLVVLL